MSKFTPVYKQAKKVFNNQKYAEPEWQKFLMEICEVKSLLGPKGFDAAHASAPESIRKKIKEKSKNAPKGAAGEVIYKASLNTTSKGSWKERAAALEMLRHLYHAHKTGGQDVWVYSPPKKHSKQVFDEMKGSDDTVKKKLGLETEIFQKSDMQLMCTALKVSLKIVMDAMVKLGKKSSSTKQILKRWFLDEDCGQDEMNEAFTKLSEGFKKIAAACGSSSLVFTDYLDWRKQRNDYFGAAFRGGEGGGFPVIYLEGAFTRLKGNTGKLWLCAETIIHEFSHHEVSTEDHRYDVAGLKPVKSSFPYAKAIANADSWGYFAVDLAGYLSASDRNSTLK